MANEDMNAGPQVGQVVRYNNGGTLTAAIIYAVSVPNSTVDLLYLTTGGPLTSAAGVSHDPNIGTSKWAYPGAI